MAEKEYLYTEEEVRKMWERDPEDQYQIALAKCLEAITRTDGEVAVSFSGGKDSAVEDCEKYGCEYEESEFVLVEAEVAAVAERSND